MGKYKQLRERLINGKISLEKLYQLKDDLSDQVDKFISNDKLSKEEFDEVTELIMILLDYYTYSDNGNEIISDHKYDMLMNHYIANGGHQLYKADILKSKTQWEFVKHESPGMVGTVKKIYSFEELCVYFDKYKSCKGRRKYRIAPKFDGISSAIKISKDGEVLLAVTRNNGIEGQNITELVRKSWNMDSVVEYYAIKCNKNNSASVWVKTELVVTTDDFEKLKDEKGYQNRRSATSGIVNTPKNVELGKYISTIPLAAHYTSTDKIEYAPLDSIEVEVSKPYDLMEEVEKMLSKIRDSKYPIRTDGVVIYPLGDDILPNFDDIMDDAIAYKVNTEEGLTTVDFGYVSLGRLGQAVPMLRVHPVEVNETIVTDVSLGSFDKFANMDIHEGEQVIIYSAGNVIPQAKLPEERHYNVKAPLIKIKKRCPYCKEKLNRYGGIYRCENPECPRVVSGRITNFLVKLNAENVSDKTIDELVSHGLIRDIPDLFDLHEDDIRILPGFGTDSAKLIIREIDKIRNTETPVSALIGALGITGISTKKCQNMFKVLSLKEMLKMDSMKLAYELIDANNTGEKTAKTFANFITSNKKLIKQLVSIMNVVNDIAWKGNVVFTGIGKDSELEKLFNSIGYEVSNNINGDTIAVIDKSYNHDSTKCQKARSRGIDILHVSEVDKILKKPR